MKKILSFLLVFALLATNAVYGASEQTQEVTKYHLDIGFQQAWYIGGKWESDSVNTYEPGTEITVTSTIDLRNEIKSAKLLTVEQADFPFYVDDTHSMNYTDYLKGKTTYENNYKRFVSTKITPISAVPNGTKVTITYKAILDGMDQFDLVGKLISRKDSEEYLYGLLGGKNAVQTYQPEIYKRFEDSYNNGLPEGTKAYMYFTPNVIEYVVADEPIPEEPPQVTPPADTTGSCTDVIKWSEIKTHTYTVGSGLNKVTRTCSHVYAYQATLSSTATLTTAKPNGNSTTFKSGYGFSINLKNTLSTKQISNSGACGKSLTKTNSKVPAPPTAAEVRTNWTVKNAEKKKTQPQNIALKLASQTATSSTFSCAPNSVSNSNNALIYTDVALKGTKQKPMKHTITVYPYGGGVNGVQFCKPLLLTFTINGNMYEDDFTVDTHS